jgi:hypothetical protein
MVLITKRKPVATLGGHMIYQVKDTIMNQGKTENIISIDILRLF